MDSLALEGGKAGATRTKALAGGMFKVAAAGKVMVAAVIKEEDQMRWQISATARRGTLSISERRLCGSHVQRALARRWL